MEIFHGNGKEYYNDGNIKFEGKFLNGKKWNGKEYDVNNNLLYELINGKGIVKEYYFYNNNKLKYEGEYLNGERHGKGKEYDENGKLIFEGEYFNDKRCDKEKGKFTENEKS